MSAAPRDHAAHEAALNQYQEAMRRTKWPPLLFLLAFLTGAILAQGLHWKVAGLAVVVAGFVMSTVMVLGNLRVQRAAAKKLRQFTTPR